nr:glycoside hydrolase family 3 protein [uncultured Sellimonas sp.]
MGRLALGIGCMLVSAGAFAAVIYFSQAGQNEVEKEPVSQQASDEKDKNSGQEVSQETQNTEIDQKLEELTLQEKIAQMFMITPDALTGVDGTWNPGEVTETAYKERPVGGLIMMENNLVSADQIRTWNDAITGFSKETVGLVPFLSVDEEGGTVARIAGNAAFGIENVGNMSEIGASGDSQEAYQAGVTIGTYLKDLGFNMDFAPVADVWTNPENTVLQYRSFGSDPKVVSEMVSEAVKGFHSQGICTTVKHFPGHGGTSGDSHEGSVFLNSTKEELEACEFLPFQAAIEEGTEFVMVGHISLPNILNDNTPASLSEEVVTEMLREDLGFDGIVITDAMNMGAIADNYTSAEAAVQAVQAGVDMILMPQDFEDAYQGILSAVNSGTISEDRIDESVRRILEVKMDESGESAS